MVFVDEDRSHFSRRNIFDLCPWAIPENHAIEPTSFRLFELFPGEIDGEVCGRIFTVDRDEAPGFTFLSHLAAHDHFEPETDFGQPAIVNSHMLNLPTGLRTAFRRQRHTTRSQHLFVPFLCVNELDNNEKSYYWLNLRHIMAKATLCKIWMGEPPDEESVNMFERLGKFSRALGKYKRGDEDSFPEEDELVAKGISWLRDRRIWFYPPTMAEIFHSEVTSMVRYAYISQKGTAMEIAAETSRRLNSLEKDRKRLHSKTYIAYGKGLLPFEFCRDYFRPRQTDPLRRLDYLVTSMRDLVRQALSNKMIYIFGRASGTTSLRYIPPIQSLFLVTQLFHQEFYEYIKTRGQMTKQTKTELILNALYSMAQGTVTSVDGAAVWTWGGIDYGGGDYKLIYDYLKGAAVYNNDMSHLFCFPRFPQSMPGAQSWVPRVDGLDGFNGIVRDGWKEFTPCKDDIEGAMTEIKDTGVHCFKGEIVTNISRVMGPCETDPDRLKANFDAGGMFMGSASMQDMHDRMVELCRARYGYQDIQLAWRKFVGMLMQNRSGEYSDVKFTDRGIQLWKLFSEAEKDKSNRDSISDDMIIEFRNFFKPMTGQSLFVAPMAGRALSGMGPSTIQPNDLVALVYGSRYPLVLRRKAHPAGSRAYQLLGGAYVDGAMEGECYKGKPKKLILV